jgi:hypothetical protein
MSGYKRESEGTKYVGIQNMRGYKIKREDTRSNVRIKNNARVNIMRGYKIESEDTTQKMGIKYRT